MAHRLLLLTDVDGGVIATASELFECRHYPGVVAVCSDALDSEPECVPILLMRARAHIALRRDLDAQADLRDIIRLDPQCSLAYRLLGELAARRDENESAAIFFREALRLDPGDREAADWLMITDASVRPAAVASKLPAPATAAGRFPPLASARIERARTGSDARAISAPARHERPGTQPRFARGTQTPDQNAQDAQDAQHAHEERPTKPFARGSDRRGDMWRTPPEPTELPPPPSVEQVIMLDTPKAGEASTSRGRPATSVPPAKQAPRAQPRPIPRGTTPELPGFGEYLVATGILTRERLRAAQAYQRSMKVQLSTAIVTLGLATPQRIEWASVAHQSQLPRSH